MVQPSGNLKPTTVIKYCRKGRTMKKLIIAVFTIYEIYRFLHTHSMTLFFVIIIDIIIFLLIISEIHSTCSSIGISFHDIFFVLKLTVVFQLITSK